ncbi:hypothetical protein ACFL01_03495 [Planctomycetota bacterium]
MAKQDESTLFINALVLGELAKGVARLPESHPTGAPLLNPWKDVESREGS